MHRLRRQRGSAIAETGPALLMLLVFIFFPMLDLLYIGAGYGMAWLAHRAAIRELAVHTPDDTGRITAIERANREYLATGMAKFLALDATTLKHDPPTYLMDASGNPNTVKLITRAQIKSLFVVPFFSSIPGLGAPVPVSFASEKPQEEKGRD